MKKLWTILILCLLSLFCAVGFVACDEDNTGKEEQQQQQPADEGSGNSDGGQTATAMTKDEFITELVKRETATWANNKLHYATVDCKLVLNMGDAAYDGEYEQTCDITYGSIPNGENFAYTDVKKGKDGNYKYQQQDVLFLSSYFNSMFGQMSADMLAVFKFEKNGDKLKLLVDIEYTAEETTVKVYMEYEFDANGYLIYCKESGARSIEFTAKAYNRTKDLDIDAFLACLLELENYSYDFRRYATLTATIVVKEGADPETSKTETIDLVYDYDRDEHQVVYAKNKTVLGLSYTMEEVAGQIPDGVYEVKKVGSTYDVSAEFDADMHMIIHYIFDKDGYLIYSYEKEGDEYLWEITAISYNKVGGEGQEPVDGVITEEQFFAELEARENKTFADETLRYDTVEFHYVETVEHNVDINDSSEIEYNDYGSDKTVEAAIYYERLTDNEELISVQKVLFFSKYVKSTIKNGSIQVLLSGGGGEITYSAHDGLLECYFNCPLPIGQAILHYIFDENGYLTYRKEFSGDETSDKYSLVEFTAISYNKADVA